LGWHKINLPFKASLGDNKKDSFGYATYVKQAKLKRLPYKEWAKAQTCHHCVKPGHVCPTCKKYLEGFANGTIKLVPCTSKVVAHCDKFNRNPKLKAFLLAIAMFATDCNDIDKVIDDGEGDQIKDNENNAGDNKVSMPSLG
jgi:hypothetical protein